MPQLYAIVSTDAPDAEARRDGARAAHFAHLATILDRIAVAGPLKDEAGQITGSLVVLHAASAAEARAILESDPYHRAGVWCDVRIAAFIALAGTWASTEGSKA